MINAFGIPAFSFHWGKFSKRALPFLGAAALLLTGCRFDEALGDGNARPSSDSNLGPNAGKNVLSYGLSTTVPPLFTDVQVTAALSQPVAMDFAPDGRLFVCEKSGNLRIIKNGSLLPTPFMTLNVDTYQERGLLGVAFDPNFPIDKYIYVYYTPNIAPAHNRVSRFLVSSGNPDLVQAGSEQILLELENLNAGIHNGGAIHFGADGKLYIAVGENSQPTMAQRLDIVLGKIARINKDGSIPTDNPFYATQSGRARAIWAYGMRNPFTFAVQPGTGRIFVNDVGQDKWEEIDDLQRGNNYGWADAEGTDALDPNFAYTKPWLAYDHTQGCSIIGASFYNPANKQFPASYVGKYFYGDYCQGWIKNVDVNTKATAGFATGISNLVDIKTGPEGALYYLTLNGVVSKISYTGTDAPVISTQPAGVLVTVGGSATFTVSATGTSPKYQWQRNTVNIVGATDTSYTIGNAQTADNGASFRAVVSNASGTVTSAAAVLSVTTSKPPVPTIATPASGATYTAGNLISFSGSATDPDEGSLPASDLTWTVTFQHDVHNHPVLGPLIGSTGSFTPANSGETSPNVWYRITLTAKDASGLTTTIFRDVQPVKANITLTSSVAGLQLKLDGQPITTPYTFQGVAGVLRSIEAISPQPVQGSFWNFGSWSDGGARIHNLITPSTNSTVTANYSQTTWMNQDVGAAGIAGSFSISGSTLTLKGSGADIWGAADAFQYAYQSLPGDGMITARVASIQNTDPWAKAGVMIRENTAAGSRHAFEAVTSANGVNFQRREATNGQSLSNGVGGAAPYWVRLVRSGPSIKAYHSTNGTAWTLTGETVQPLGANLLIGLAVTSHNNGVLATAVFDNVSVVRDTWVSNDIGGPGTNGSAVGYGSVQVSGGGNDIWGNADQFFYWSRTITGDGEIKARVASVHNTDPWAKAGVMIRESFAAGSKHAFTSVTPGNGLEFLHRDATDGASTPVAAAGTAPRWVRMTRVGNLFTSSVSTDGVNWTTIGTATISMGSVVNVGLGVCSHQGAIINNSIFDNITVTD